MEPGGRRPIQILAVLLLFCTACLTAPPANPPNQSRECQKAFDYSFERYEDITGEYRNANIVLGTTGVILYFIFPEALAIPVVGLPISYLQHESLADDNVNTLIRDCSRKQN